MKTEDSGAVQHGMPVLVRNASNDKWMLRTADRIDGTWVGEIRLSTAEGECWKQWIPYAGNEAMEGTSLPKNGKWRRGDVCAYDDGGRLRIGFFFGFGTEADKTSGKEAEKAFISDVPIAWAGIEGAEFSDLELTDIPSSALKRPEDLWPWWKPSLYAEQPDPNPFGARVVPV